MHVVSLVSAMWLACLLVGGSPQAQDPSAPQSQSPTFRSGVELVTISAIVRDQKGRFVPELTRDQFEVFDRGERRAITEFRPDEAPLTVALLFDASGSMSVASNVEEAKKVAAHVMAWLNRGRDEVALFSFDTQLDELQPFSKSQSDLHGALSSVEPFGMTSLNDAIAETARRVAARGGSHRAVIVFTDGNDNASRLTPPEVSGIASRIDVPIYIVVVASPLDARGLQAALGPGGEGSAAAQLANLAAWTGGALYVCINGRPAEASVAAREIVDELRHQYLLAFEPGTQPGWHRVEVRVRDKRLTVRARSGYYAAEPRNGS